MTIRGKRPILSTVVLMLMASTVLLADTARSADAKADGSRQPADRGAHQLERPVERPRVARNQKRPVTNVQCWGCFEPKRCGPDDVSCWSDHSGRACNINQGECNLRCSTQNGCAPQ